MKRLLKWILIGILSLLVIATCLCFGGIWYARWDIEREQKRIAKNLEALPLADSHLFLLSLDPGERQQDEVNTETVFHGFPILGQAEIRDQKEKQTLISVLATAIRQGNPNIVASCFNPHHGLRLVDSSGVHDLVICFSCGQIDPYNFNSDQGIAITGHGHEEFDSFLDQYKLRKPQEW